MVHASIRTQRAGWHSSWEHKAAYDYICCC
jgi:hypothetical protein